MKKSPIFALKNCNAASQSVPNKKPSTSTLNYLQILKQYNSCNKLVKTEASSLQPAARTKTSKDATAVNLILQQTQRPKFTNINTTSSKNIFKPQSPFLNTHIDDKVGSPPPFQSKLLANKQMVKVPFDTYLRTSKSKESEGKPPIPPPSIFDKAEKENVYFVGDRNLSKRNSKLVSNGSDRESLHKEKMQSSPKDHLNEMEKKEEPNHEISNNNCVFHPEKKAKYMKAKYETSDSPTEINYYCSKCAIDLAVKGIRVYDIEENKNLVENKVALNLKEKGSLHSFEPSPENSPKIEEKTSEFEKIYKTSSRRDEIDEFLIKLEGVKKNGNSSCALLERRQEEITNFYSQQITKTEEFFKRLEIVLQTNKRMLVDKLYKFKEDAENSFKNLKKQSEYNLTEIQKIEFDIRENVENILKNMEELPFKTIITKYDSKISHFQKSCFDMYKEPLILNKILISFKNYKEQENNFSKFNEEVWNLVRPYFSFNRIPVTFLEEYNDLELMASPRNDFKKDIFVSFENKDLFEENQKSMMTDDDKKSLNCVEKHLFKNENLNSNSTESLSSPTSKKYLDLLNKINNNQENNNIFFNNLMIKNDGGSPGINEQKNSEVSCQEFVKFKQKQDYTPHTNAQKNFFSPNFRENLDI